MQNDEPTAVERKAVQRPVYFTASLFQRFKKVTQRKNESFSGRITKLVEQYTAAEEKREEKKRLKTLPGTKQGN